MRRPVARSSAIAAATLAAGIVLAAAALPQLAAAATSPKIEGVNPNGYVYANSKQCVRSLGAPEVVQNGVSAAQRTLQFTRAWQFNRGMDSQGNAVRVGVIDTGVNPGPAFGNRLVGAADLIVPKDPDATQPGLDDCDGHGTLVAGLIAASPDAKSGFSGVAPLARIYSIRQTSDNYSYKDSKDNEHAAGLAGDLGASIRYLVDHDNVSIINISVAKCAAVGSVDNDTGDLTNDVAYAVSHNVVVVVAAGNVDQNKGCSPQNVPGKTQVTAATPADLPGVLAVGAIDTSGSPASFSLVGRSVGIAAPGTDIISVNPFPGNGGQVNTVISENGTGSIQGTSFAAPYVSGVAALVRGEHPDWTNAEVIKVLEQTAAHPAAPGGRNEYVGYGLVDPVAAVTAPRPGTTTVRAAANPVVLPADVTTHTSTRPKHVALYGSLVVGLLILAGAIGVQTRRTRRRAAAQLRTRTRRELAGSR